MTDLGPDTLTADLGGSLRCGTTALRLALDAVKAGTTAEALVSGSWRPLPPAGACEALRGGRLSAGELVSRTGLGQPNASMHLRCLAECGLVTWEREGRLVYYRIADKGVVQLLDQSEELARRVGPLIDACPRYRQPWREPQPRGRRGGRR